MPLALAGMGRTVGAWEPAENNFSIWDGFSFRATGQRFYSPVRRAGKLVAKILCFSA